MGRPREVPTNTVAWVLFAAMLVFFSRTAVVFTRPPSADPATWEIASTGVTVTWLWAWMWPVALSEPVAARSRGRRLGERLWYTFGLGVCLFHIAVAFHTGHEWSHQKAYEHTERVGGAGWGVYVNYAFVAVWLADVTWMWVSFDSYKSRPRWVGWLVVGFMGFVVLNAAVVFGSGMRRWASLLFLAVPAGLVAVGWWTTRRGGPRESR